jgi:hypothetical protein
MRTQHNLWKTLSVIPFLFPATVFASGQGVGNGGNTVVCKDSSGKIKTVTLMDLWEGRNNASPEPMAAPLSISTSSAPVSQQIEQAIKRLRLDAPLEAYFRNELAWIQKNLTSVPSNMSLTPVPEIMPILEQDGCDFELVANYFNDDTIMYNPTLRALLDLEPTNEAALLVHETLYKMARDLAQAKDSVKVRKLVAYSFADQEDASSIATLVRETFALDRYTGTFVHVDRGVDGFIQMNLYYKAQPNEVLAVHETMLDANGVVQGTMSWSPSPAEIVVTPGRPQEASVNIWVFGAVEQLKQKNLTVRINVTGVDNSSWAPIFKYDMNNVQLSPAPPSLGWQISNTDTTELYVR